MENKDTPQPSTRRIADLGWTRWDAAEVEPLKLLFSYGMAHAMSQYISRVLSSRDSLHCDPERVHHFLRPKLFD